MSERICIVDGCQRKHLARGYCGKHYRRHRLYGDPLARQRIRGEDEARFLSYVEKTPTCWHWTGGLDHGGYGRFDLNGRNVCAHRWAYEAWRGEIPEDLEVDHICHTQDHSCVGGGSCPHRRCVNPAHLEPVEHQENCARGAAGRVANTERCTRGHEHTPDNTHIRRRGGRECRACMAFRAREQRRKQKKNAAAAAV